MKKGDDYRYRMESEFLIKVLELRIESLESGREFTNDDRRDVKECEKHIRKIKEDLARER